MALAHERFYLFIYSFILFPVGQISFYSLFGDFFVDFTAGHKTPDSSDSDKIF